MKRALIVVLMLACSRDAELQPVRVGEHALAFAVPDGWEVLSQGRQVTVRSGETTITLTDLGPVTPQGLLQELDAIEALWKGGSEPAARTRLEALPFLATSSREDRSGIQSLTHAVLELPRGMDPGEKFVALRAFIESMEAPELEAVADALLPELGHDRRREVKSRTPVRVDSHDALSIETWSALTHDWPARYVFIRNSQRLLVIRCDRYAVARDAFEAMVASLRFTA